MKKISSTFTTFHKRLFPAMWFGFLAFFTISAFVRGIDLEREWVFVLGPSFMAAAGFFLMKKLLWDLVDEVYDCGEFLLVRSKGEEENVPLSNIVNVSASVNSSPPRITLHLVHPGKFGSEISFSPHSEFSFNPFAKNPIAQELMLRVDQARRKRVV